MTVCGYEGSVFGLLPLCCVLPLTTTDQNHLTVRAVGKQRHVSYLTDETSFDSNI